MPSLADTIARLRQGRPEQTSRDSSVAASLQAVCTFGENPGNLTMFVHAPESLRSGAALVVVLHGCTQDAAAFVEQAGWLELATRAGFAILAPQQTVANNPNRCFNWFQPEDTSRGLGEAASIANMVDHMVSQRGIDPALIYITGLSAGGAMSAAMLAVYPELFAGGSIVAGLPFGAADDLLQAIRAMHRVDTAAVARRADRVRASAPIPRRAPKLCIWHGDADWIVDVCNAGAIADQCAETRPLYRSEAETSPGDVKRTVWSDAFGIAQIELNIVPGMGHGVPLSTFGPDGLGRSGPFMLEVGVSSTLESAQFWGLIERPEFNSRDAAKNNGFSAAAPNSGTRLAESVLTSIAGYVSSDVSKVIVKALTAAGLMK